MKDRPFADTLDSIFSPHARARVTAGHVRASSTGKLMQGPSAEQGVLAVLVCGCALACGARGVFVACEHTNISTFHGTLSWHSD